MIRWISGISILLSSLPVMMALQILTGTWTWPFGGDGPPLSKEIQGIAEVGALAIFWNAMIFFFWWNKTKTTPIVKATKE